MMIARRLRIEINLRREELGVEEATNMLVRMLSISFKMNGGKVCSCRCMQICGRTNHSG